MPDSRDGDGLATIEFTKKGKREGFSGKVKFSAGKRGANVGPTWGQRGANVGPTWGLKSTLRNRDRVPRDLIVVVS